MLASAVTGAAIATALTVLLTGVFFGLNPGRGSGRCITVMATAAAVLGGALGAVDYIPGPPEDGFMGCPDGEVRAAPDNNVARGCIPLELAEKIAEGENR